jgi:hypothetical protein
MKQVTRHRCRGDETESAAATIDFDGTIGRCPKNQQEPRHARRPSPTVAGKFETGHVLAVRDEHPRHREAAARGATPQPPKSGDHLNGFAGPGFHRG